MAMFDYVDMLRVAAGFFDGAWYGGKPNLGLSVFCITECNRGVQVLPTVVDNCFLLVLACGAWLVSQAWAGSSHVAWVSGMAVLAYAVLLSAVGRWSQSHASHELAQAGRQLGAVRASAKRVLVIMQ